MDFLPGLIVPNVRYFGLSIDRSSLRAVELASQTLVRSFAEISIDEDLVKDGILIHPMEFTKALRTLFINGHFTTPYVSVCFPESYAYTRDHTVPDISADEIDEAIAWKIKDLFPLPQEDIYYDWKRLDVKDGQLHIGVVGIQKKILDPLVDAIIAAGLKPLRFEPDASAVARLIGFKPKQYGLMTEVNKRNAYVTLVEGEKSLFTTVISYLQTDTPVTFLENITNSLDDIAKYYTAKGMLDTNNAQVIVTGEIGSKDWADYMSKKIPYPIKILSTPVGNPSFNKAYASASTLIAPPKDDLSINLMPKDVQAIYDESWKIGYLQKLAVKVFVAVVCLLLFPVFVLLSVLSQKQALLTQVNTLTSVIRSQDSSIGKVTALNGQLESVLGLAPLKKTPSEKIMSVSTLHPAGIRITQLEYDDSKQLFTISGTANERNDLLEFRNKLDSSKEFTKIVLPLGFLETDANTDFSMTFIGSK